MGHGVLFDLVWVLVAACAALFVGERLKISPVVGFLFTGLVIGPHGTGLVGDIHGVEPLAEAGEIALLFTVGIEFSLSTLMRLKTAVLVGGSLQMGISAFFIGLLLHLSGLPVLAAGFAGLTLATSSTTMVLRFLQEEGRLDAPVGKNSVGILIFQDLAVVPIILLIPVMAGKVGLGGSLLLLAKGLLVVAGVLFVARFGIPQLLFRVVKTRSRELFLLVLVGICVGIACLTAAAGLSLALGAFLAGVAVAESEYSHEALFRIQPLRDVFACFFFVAVGMLLDPNVLMASPVKVLLGVGILMAIKILVGAVAVRATGYAWSVGISVGIFLAQAGEFAFVLFSAARPEGILPAETESLLISVVVLSMAISPMLSKWAMGLETAEAVEPKATRGGFPDAMKDHLVVIGYGLCGQHLVKVARAYDIPVGVVEMNPDTVRTLEKKGLPVIWGDAAGRAALAHARMEDAAVCVVAVNDPVATRRITAAVRRVNPTLQLLVRTPYVSEMEELVGMGADEVIPEEFETSVEIVSRVLQRFRFPLDAISGMVDEIRGGGYAMLRELSIRKTGVTPPDIPETDMAVLRIGEADGVCDKAIGESGFRENHDLIILAVERDGTILPNPQADLVLSCGDRLHVFGTRRALGRFRARQCRAQ